MKKRYVITSFDSVVYINAGTDAELMCRSDHDFLPESIVIPERITPYFLITSFVIGKTSQFVGNCIHTDVFSSKHKPKKFLFSPAKAHQKMTLRVTNPTPHPVRFHASVIGRVI